MIFDLKQRIAEINEQAKQLMADVPQPVASVHASEHGKALNVSLDQSKDSYGAHIKGEGADISLQRDFDTDKVVGARLPLYARSLLVCATNAPTLRIDLETGEVFREENNVWRTLVPAKEVEVPA